MPRSSRRLSEKNWNNGDPNRNPGVINLRRLLRPSRLSVVRYPRQEQHESAYELWRTQNSKDANQRINHVFSLSEQQRVKLEK